MSTSLDPVLQRRPLGLDRPKTAEMAINEARLLLSDLFVYKPWIYWTDLFITLAIGYTAAGIYLAAPLGSWQQIAGFIVGGFALFRAGSFVHEITHMRGGHMLSFRVGWNLVCGIPMIMPSHFYENHIDHHNSHLYGT